MVWLRSPAGHVATARPGTGESSFFPIFEYAVHRPR